VRHIVRKHIATGFYNGVADRHIKRFARLVAADTDDVAFFDALALTQSEVDHEVCVLVKDLGRRSKRFFSCHIGLEYSPIMKMSRNLRSATTRQKGALRAARPSLT